jgi:putative flavoprotein involved in K+ transport
MGGFCIRQSILTTGLGVASKEQAEKGGAPLIGIPKNAFERAGVERVPRMVGVQDGKPLLQDGRELSVANVIWCTGYAPDYRWIHLPVFGSEGYPIHARGVVEGEAGLYFLGLPFQYTLTSSFIGGVGKRCQVYSRANCDTITWRRWAYKACCTITDLEVASNIAGGRC